MQSKLVLTCITWLVFQLDGSVIVNASTQLRAGSNAFYSECSIKALCFGTSESGDDKDCLLAKPKPNCVAGVSFKYNNDTTNTTTTPPKFEVQMFFRSTTNGNYFATGIGESNSMTNLAILECIHMKNGDAMGHVSWAPDRIIPSRSSASSLEFLQSYKVDGEDVLCEFHLPTTFKISGTPSQQFDLIRKKYFVHVAYGSVEDDNTLTQHTDHSSWNAVHLFSINGSDRASKKDTKTQYKIHGTLMTITYMGLFPVATIIARFYKETWTSRRIFKKKIWFIVHATLTYTGLILSIIAVAFIIVTNKKIWPETKLGQKIQNHALMGASSLAIVIVQAIMPWVIPQSNIEVKNWYYKIHFVMGFVAYFLGVLNIGLASVWVPGTQPCESIFVTCLWAASHLSFYIVLTTLLIIKDSETEDGEPCRAVTAYPMKIQTMEDAPGVTARVIILWSFVAVSLIICAAMSGMLFTIVPCNKRVKTNKG